MTAAKETHSDINGEQRRAARMRCLREARCVFNNNSSDVTVLMRNVSATGAKLAGNSLFRLPDEFDLQTTEGAEVSARRVRRVWSQLDSIGVVFLEPARKIAARPAGATAVKRPPSPFD